VSPLPATFLVAASSAAGAAALALPPPRRVPRRNGSRGASRHGPRPLRSLATVAVTLGAMVFVGGQWGVPVGLLAGAGCWWVTGRMEPPAVRRRRERLAAAVPHAVDLMAACLSAGLSPAAAVEQVAQAVEPPLSEELAAVCARLRMGVDPVTVWRDLAAHPQLGRLGRTVARAAESGASVADAMLRLSDDLRRQSRAEVESRARAVGVKAALPLGACLLPAFVLVGVVPLVAGSVSVLLR
jgi:Flp pilus assembly protein TadB